MTLITPLMPDLLFDTKVNMPSCFCQHYELHTKKHVKEATSHHSEMIPLEKSLAPPVSHSRPFNFIGCLREWHTSSSF